MPSGNPSFIFCFKKRGQKLRMNRNKRNTFRNEDLIGSFEKCSTNGFYSDRVNNSSGLNQ